MKIEITPPTDIGSWSVVGDIPCGLGAVKVSLPGEWAQAPAFICLEGLSATVLTVQISKTGRWSVNRFLLSHALVACRKERKKYVGEM